jgi:8-oxo-dGTP diphosphatase
LLKKSSSEDVTPNSYDIPGGRIEFGEELEDSLIREVREETGLNVKPLYPTNAWTFMTSDDFQLVGITFLAQYVSGEILLSDEHTQFEWISAEEIKERDFPPWLLKEFEMAEERV